MAEIKTTMDIGALLDNDYDLETKWVDVEQARQELIDWVEIELSHEDYQKGPRHEGYFNALRKMTRVINSVLGPKKED